MLTNRQIELELNSSELNSMYKQGLSSSLESLSVARVYANLGVGGSYRDSLLKVHISAQNKVIHILAT